MTASVGNLANGRTVGNFFDSGDAANAHYGYRSDDYNLQNIAAGTRVRATASAGVVDNGASLSPTTMTVLGPECPSGLHLSRGTGSVRRPTAAARGLPWCAGGDGIG